ncbi:protein of unknown function UPF0118 [Pirellula staleyi DSM 6068]|uniref:Permease n=1 Tax=Pirellula staleyi (strain ATCC 27377 / DSM 6068 / ICPB 4128) TaxID=530564 RepID=D2QZ87_PIRSD|nr:AI-2E family transporter [Pirellula staleyi]ADB18279.1 protein of unknown function UPF0118 [Pirellula staleyi DSM 6068]
MSRMVSFVVLVVILIVFAVLFVRVMQSFLLPLFLAALLGVVFQPLHRWSLRVCREQNYIAATFTTILVLLSVLVPVSAVVTLATLEGLSLIEQLRVENVREKLADLRAQFSLDIPRAGDLRRLEASLNRWRDEQREGETPVFTQAAVDNLIRRADNLEEWQKENAKISYPANIEAFREVLVNLRDSAPETIERDDALIAADAEFRVFKRDFLGGPYRAWLTELANPTDEQIEDLRQSTLLTASSPLVSLGSDTVAIVGKLAFGVVIMVAALFFLFAEGGKMLNAAIRLSPLEERYVRELVGEFDRVCRAVVAATLLSAVAQGILAGIGFYFAGVQHAVALLMVLTCVLAIVPFTGAAAVWIPTSIYLYYDGHTTAAILLAIYGAAIVSTADNIIKPLVLHGQSNLHPLLALLSVIGGIQALGPIGILVGPMVVVFLQTLLKLLQRELTSLDRAEEGGAVGWAALFRPRAAAGNAGTSKPGDEHHHDSFSSSEEDSTATTHSGDEHDKNVDVKTRPAEKPNGHGSAGAKGSTSGPKGKSKKRR